ncbi:hypothetical protein O988_03861 [Pseudogymnoascus sp. VKM F-3808]|nr:hypothetical protein O988_03861 [Pseudogymnoascus sp. VKM F-3808]
MSYNPVNDRAPNLPNPLVPPPDHLSERSYHPLTLPYNPLTNRPYAQPANTPRNPFSPPLNPPSSYTASASATLSFSSPSPNNRPGEGLGYYSDYSSASDPSDNDYSPPPLSPVEPDLEYEDHGEHYFSSCSESSSDSDDEYDGEGESAEEYDTAYSDSERVADLEDEKRADIRERGKQEAREGCDEHASRRRMTSAAAEGIDKTLKESLAALRVQELKKIAEDNEKKKETPLWKSFMTKFIMAVLLFVAAFATVWVVNEVHYRQGLPFIKFVRGHVAIPGPVRSAWRVLLTMMRGAE